MLNSGMLAREWLRGRVRVMLENNMLKPKKVIRF
jgi:hypothetical protein